MAVSISNYCRNLFIDKTSTHRSIHTQYVSPYHPKALNHKPHPFRALRIQGDYQSALGKYSEAAAAFEALLLNSRRISKLKARVPKVESDYLLHLVVALSGKSLIYFSQQKKHEPHS